MNLFLSSKLRVFEFLLFNSFKWKILIFLFSLFCKKIILYLFVILQLIIFCFSLFEKGEEYIYLSYIISFYTKICLYFILMNYEYIMRNNSKYHEFKADIFYAIYYMIFYKLEKENWYQNFILYHIILFNIIGIIFIYKYIDEIKFNFITNNCSGGSIYDYFERTSILIEKLFINIFIILSFNFKSYVLIYLSKTNYYLLIALLMGELFGILTYKKIRKLSFLCDFLFQILNIILFFALSEKSIYYYVVSFGIGMFNGYTSLMIYKQKNLLRDFTIFIQSFLTF